jgi:hypothetical protein
MPDDKNFDHMLFVVVLAAVAAVVVLFAAIYATGVLRST